MSKLQETKISKFQILVQRMITRCNPSTPKVLLDLLINMDLLPLKLENQALALKAENRGNVQKIKSSNYQKKTRKN